MCLNLLRFNAVNYGKNSVVNACPHFKRGGQEITWSSVFRVSYQKIIYFRCINDNCDSCEISRPWVLRNCCVVRSENSAFWCLLSFSICLCMSVCLSVCLSLSMSVLAHYLFIHLFISLLLLMLLSLNTVLDLKETISMPFSLNVCLSSLSIHSFIHFFVVVDVVVVEYRLRPEGNNKFVCTRVICHSVNPLVRLSERS